MSERLALNSVPSPLVALAAWLVPGAGYWLLGQRGRGLTVGITILLLFALGLLIGGMKVVDAPRLAELSNGSLLKVILAKPWFIGQVFVGPLSLLTANIARSDTFLASHARLNEIGTLYTAVAGMLNLLTIIDATSRASRTGGRA